MSKQAAKESSTTDVLINKLVKDNSNAWKKIIGERTSKTMETEGAQKLWLIKDRSTINARQRVDLVSNIANQYTNALSNTNTNNNESKEEKKENDDNKKTTKNEIIKGFTDNKAFESTDYRKEFTFTECKSMEYCYNLAILDKNDKADSRLAELSNNLYGNFYINKNDLMYYYETIILDDKAIKDGISIGYAGDKHRKHLSVGESGVSYAWNTKGIKLNNDKKYGDKWSTGDILGCSVNLKSKYIEYYLNGKSLGKAFNNIENEILTIGLTVSKEQKVNIIINEKSMKHKPKDMKCFPIDLSNEDKLETYLDGKMKYNINQDKTGIDITECETRYASIVVKLSGKLSKDNSYYYEVKLGSSSFMQIGLANPDKFKGNAQRGEGIGDDDYSYGFDGERCLKWGNDIQFYKNDLKLKNNDIIGCLLNYSKKEIEYFINGKSIGTLFDNVNVTKITPMISLPAKTSKSNNVARVLFDKSQCKYFPENCLGINDCIEFKLENICNSLPQYSLKQYKNDLTMYDDVIHVKSEKEFDEILAVKDKLIVVDFFATWCGPCVYISPLISDLAKIEQNILFIKIDVDALSSVSQRQHIQAMPTFQYFKNGIQIDSMTGASIDGVKEKIKFWSDFKGEIKNKVIKISENGDNEFNKIIKENKIVFVDWFATWCGPCKMISPIIDGLAIKYQKEITFVKIDVDKNKNLKTEAGIKAFPTFFIYKDGEVQKDLEIVGADDEKIVALIEKLAKSG